MSADAAAGKKRTVPESGSGAPAQAQATVTKNENPFEPEITEEINAKLFESTKAILRVEIVNDRDNIKRLKPAYAKRRTTLKEIPRFWPVALMQHPVFAHNLQYPEDQKAILALEDLWIERPPEESRVFTIEFHFKENPYFSDKVLKKEFRYIKPEVKGEETPDENGIVDSEIEFDFERDVVPQPIKINWKSDAVNLTKLHPRVMENGELAELGSFFNFFEQDSDPTDIGLALANDVYQEAIEAYQGKLIPEDFEMDDEDSEDSDESDSDAEEIDLEKPEAKKQRRA